MADLQTTSTRMISRAEDLVAALNSLLTQPGRYDTDTIESFLHEREKMISCLEKLRKDILNSPSRSVKSSASLTASQLVARAESDLLLADINRVWHKLSATSSSVSVYGTKAHHHRSPPPPPPNDLSAISSSSQTSTALQVEQSDLLRRLIEGQHKLRELVSSLQTRLHTKTTTTTPTTHTSAKAATKRTKKKVHSKKPQESRSEGGEVESTHKPTTEAQIRIDPGDPTPLQHVWSAQDAAHSGESIPFFHELTDEEHEYAYARPLVNQDSDHYVLCHTYQVDQRLKARFVSRGHAEKKRIYEALQPPLTWKLPDALELISVPVNRNRSPLRFIPDSGTKLEADTAVSLRQNLQFGAVNPNEFVPRDFNDCDFDIRNSLERRPMPEWWTKLTKGSWDVHSSVRLNDQTARRTPVIVR
eukprot:GILK01013707.1.p1 GENE.GILK01013707.1~~GILK01013707.1.p1  ORF type:complete len:425 (-),score=56.88 GILK01013707.1:243-1493(-)